MLTAELLQEQVASVMATLTKTAVAEICKVINSGFIEVRREVYPRQSELEAQQTKVRNLTSKGRGSTTSVEWSNINHLPLRRSVAVQVSMEQELAECSTLMDSGAKGEAVVELIMKVEGGEKLGTQVTNQNLGQDPTIDGSAVSDFSQWTVGSSHQGTTDRNYGEFCLDAPTFSPHQSDTSTEPHSGSDRVSQLPTLAAPLCRHSSALLPAACDLVKEEEEEEGVDAPGVEKTDTGGQTHGHKPLQSHLIVTGPGAQTHTHTLIQKHEKKQEWVHGQGGGRGGKEEKRIFHCTAHREQLQADAEGHAGERGTKGGMTSANGAVHRKRPAEQGLSGSGDSHWHLEMDEKPSIDSYCVQDSVSTQPSEPKEPNAHHTHMQDSPSLLSHTLLTHSQDSTFAFTHTQETVSFSELQLQLKAEQEEEQVDQKLHAIPSCLSPIPAFSSPDSQLPFSTITFSEPSSSSHTRTPCLFLVSANKAMTATEPLPTQSSMPHLFHCLSCPKSFPQETALKQHERSHLDDRQFGCDVCGKSFKLRHTLQQHKVLHSGIKPFACHYCGRRFSHPSNLKAHLRIHTGERPYRCPVCRQTFAHHSNLTRHQNRLHNINKAHELLQSNIKPFACRYCGKHFTQVSNLKAHQRIHTGERPYLCPVCKQTFAHHSNLIRHQKQLHSRNEAP